MIKILSVIFCLIVSSATYAESNIVFDSLVEAQAVSESTDKPILLIFGADYCGHCRSLKQDIISDKFHNIFNRYVICYIDIQQYPEIKKEYVIGPVPDSRIIFKKKEISSMKGYSKLRFMRWINQ